MTAAYPFYYGLMNARGFVSPYILKDGRCTACIDNHLRNTNIDELVDHIYITTDTTERVRSAEVGNWAAATFSTHTMSPN